MTTSTGLFEGGATSEKSSYSELRSSEMISSGWRSPIRFAAAKSAAAAYLFALDDELRGTGVQVSICFPMGAVDTEANRRELGRERASQLIEPSVIGAAFVAAAGSGQGGRLLEIPVHPPG